MSFPSLLHFCTGVLMLNTFMMIHASAQTTENSNHPQAETENGIVEGLDISGVQIYHGIPFAQPPVGDLRWREPQPAEDWTGVLETKSFRDMCMQLPVFDDMVFRSSGMSEDCLYLNVWTPAKSADDNLPVLVYYYGGGFIAGDGSEGRYDGESMARNKGVVTVTVNYRLGVFGFMAHPELTETSPHNASGNYGLLDQAKALQWVKDNIAAFGGDPDNITIAGESAGSVSVSALMASPLSRDLIAGAIGESGSILGTLPPVSLEEGEQNGITFMESADAVSLEDLRNMPAEDVLEASGQPGLPRFSPTVDGYFFPKSPLDIYEAGEQSDVPLFVGWNSLEMNYRMIFGDDQPGTDTWLQKLEELYPDNYEQVSELYPGSTKEEVLKSATDLAGDRFIGYSTWKWSDIHAQTTGQPVYRYYYAHPRPPMKEKYAGEMENTSPDTEESDSLPEPEGAVHAAEIEYIMGNLHHNDVYAWTEEDFRVSDIFHAYAANFVRKLDPNGSGVPVWTPINRGENPKVINISADTYLMDEMHRERYKFLDQLTRSGTE